MVFLVMGHGMDVWRAQQILASLGTLLLSMHSFDHSTVEQHAHALHNTELMGTGQCSTCASCPVLVLLCSDTKLQLMR